MDPIDICLIKVQPCQAEVLPPIPILNPPIYQTHSAIKSIRTSSIAMSIRHRLMPPLDDPPGAHLRKKMGQHPVWVPMKTDVHRLDFKASVGLMEGLGEKRLRPGSKTCWYMIPLPEMSLAIFNSLFLNQQPVLVLVR